MNVAYEFAEESENAGKERVFKERTNAFNDRQRRGAMRRKIHEVCLAFLYFLFVPLIHTQLVSKFSSFKTLFPLIL